MCHTKLGAGADKDRISNKEEIQSGKEMREIQKCKSILEKYMEINPHK